MATTIKTSSKNYFLSNFAIKDGENTPSRQKKNEFFLFCSRLFVSLHAI